MGNFERTRDFTSSYRVRLMLIREIWNFPRERHLWVQLLRQLEEVEARLGELEDA